MTIALEALPGAGASSTFSPRGFEVPRFSVDDLEGPRDKATRFSEIASKKAKQVAIGHLPLEGFIADLKLAAREARLVLTPASYKTIAELCLLRGQAFRAAQYFARYVERGAPDHRELNDIGVVLAAAGQYLTAKTFLEMALNKNPKEPRILNNLGMVARELRNHETAARLLDQALEIDPSHGFAWINKAILLEEVGRLEEAVNAYHTGLALPEERFDDQAGLYGNAHYLLSQCLIRLGRYPEAVKAAETGLRSDGNSLYGRLYLADSLLGVGDLERVGSILNELESSEALPPSEEGDSQNPIRAAFEAIKKELEGAAQGVPESSAPDLADRSTWDLTVAQVKARGDERFKDKLARMRRRGIVDERGEATSKDWPPDMKPGSKTDVAT